MYRIVDDFLYLLQCALSANKRAKKRKLLNILYILYVYEKKTEIKNNRE